MTISWKGYLSPSCKVRHSITVFCHINDYCLALERTAPDDDKTEADDNAQTIRPNRSPGTSVVPLAKAPPSEMKPIVEDYSDLADENELENKVANFKVIFLLSPDALLITRGFYVTDEELCP